MGSHLVSWEGLGRQLHQGGLVISNFGSPNRALLAMWFCCFYYEPEALWHKIIVSEYGNLPPEWMSKRAKGTHKNPWISISFELPTFSLLTHCIVGDGQNTYFWEDLWLGGNILSLSFPRLYHSSTLKNLSISDFWMWSENSVSFSFGFCRNLTDRETAEVFSLLSLIESYSFRLRRKDIGIWHPSPSEGFSCESYFKSLLDPSPTRQSVFEVVWKLKIPKKVSFFTWQLLLGRVNTLQWMVRKRTMLMGPFCSILCRKAEEDLNHLFWLCHYTTAVWNLFLQDYVNYARHHDFQATISEFLLNLPFKEKGSILWTAGVCAIL